MKALHDYQCEYRIHSNRGASPIRCPFEDDLFYLSLSKTRVTIPAERV